MVEKKSKTPLIDLFDVHEDPLGNLHPSSCQNYTTQLSFLPVQSEFMIG